MTPKVVAAIKEREELLAWMAEAQERERTLRLFIAKQLFPNPKEGTNNYTEQGVEVKLVHRIDRKILQEEFYVLRAVLATRGVPINKLVEAKPSLVLKEYKSLTAPQRKLFDQCLLIKPAELPSLTVSTLIP